MESKFDVRKLKVNIIIEGLKELEDIVAEMVKLASRLKNLEFTIKTGLPKD